MSQCPCVCFRAVLDDFSAARKVFAEDVDVKTVAEALQLSQDALQYDPRQLPAQMLCRIMSAPKVTVRSLPSIALLCTIQRTRR